MVRSVFSKRDRNTHRLLYIYFFKFIGLYTIFNGIYNKHNMCEKIYIHLYIQDVETWWENSPSVTLRFIHIWIVTMITICASGKLFIFTNIFYKPHHTINYWINCFHMNSCTSYIGTHIINLQLYNDFSANTFFNICFFILELYGW